LLNLTRNFLLPDYASYGNTAAASYFPTNADVADLAHQQHALVGYVHPYDFVIDPTNDPSLTHNEPEDEALELPVDAPAIEPESEPEPLEPEPIPATTP
jgi:hypothetical protein